MEIKWQPLSSADLRSFVTAIRRHRMQAHVIITSGDLGVLRVLSQIAPDVRRALVWYPNHSRPSPREVPRYVQMINVDQSQASARYVRAARRLGLLVSARTPTGGGSGADCSTDGAPTAPHSSSPIGCRPTPDGVAGNSC